VSVRVSVVSSVIRSESESMACEALEALCFALRYTIIHIHIHTDTLVTHPDASTAALLLLAGIAHTLHKLLRHSVQVHASAQGVYVCFVGSFSLQTSCCSTWGERPRVWPRKKMLV
jgi:hypothetical protein